VIADILAAGGPVCIHACTSAASGARVMATLDQTIILVGCVTFSVVAFVSGVLDIVQWREKERERKKKKGG
jgi:hypothetical protein